MVMILLFIFACILISLIPASSALACFAVVVGKKASKDGSVLFGHNEQDGGKRMLNFRVIPRIKHKPGDIVKLKEGGTLPQVEETYSFIWTDNPGLSFSDTYVNEWGVAVGSDGCGTKEDSYEELVARGEIVDGGIGYMLRRLIIQRAKTSRDGIRLAGELLSHFGYTDSGRTLVVADPNEAWLLSIARGKHWVAQRVPDDEVVILPNVHIISEINLDDEENFMGAADVVSYAIKRGWYDPSSGKPFSFRDAYNPSNQDFRDIRQLRGQLLVKAKTVDLPDTEQLPFSIKPDHNLDVNDVMKILRYHDNIRSLCAPETLEGAVFQLRNWMPPEVGCVHWRTSAEPCISVFTPWYVGITEVPKTYHKPVDIDTHLSLDYHFNPPEGTFDYDPQHTWWNFRRLQDEVNKDYLSRIKKVRVVWDDFEAKLFNNQQSLENEVLEMLAKDKDSAKSYLTEYSGNVALKAAEVSDSLYQELAKA